MPCYPYRWTQQTQPEDRHKGDVDTPLWPPHTTSLCSFVPVFRIQSSCRHHRDKPKKILEECMISCVRVFLPRLPPVSCICAGVLIPLHHDQYVSTSPHSGVPISHSSFVCPMRTHAFILALSLFVGHILSSTFASPLAPNGISKRSCKFYDCRDVNGNVPNVSR